MDTINSRIRYIRKDKCKLTQAAFANKLGMAQSLVSLIEKDGETVTQKNINLICSMFHVSEQWLKYGTGNILQTPAAELEEIVKKIMSESENPNDYTKQEILLAAAQVINDDTCYKLILEALHKLIKKDLE